MHVRKGNPELSSKALKVLIPFHVINLCEKTCFILGYIKYEFQNCVKNNGV